MFKAFATDYDGTLAHHGAVDPATVDAVTRLREAGFKTLMVTGREVPDLHKVFTECAIFDLIVAENGALLYWPLTREERVLAPTPPRAFSEFLRTHGVADLSVGRVIVATMESHLETVKRGIAQLQLDLVIIPNKGSLMVLPQGVNKGFGLTAALSTLGLAPADVVAVGDAENDQSFLLTAGYGVAVENALPLLKEQADWITPSGHGIGVRELIERLLARSLPDPRRGKKEPKNAEQENIDTSN